MTYTTVVCCRFCEWWMRDEWTPPVHDAQWESLRHLAQLDQAIRDHVRINHPRVFSLFDRLAKEWVAEQKAKAAAHG